MIEMERPHHFKYLDEDKLLPWIEKQILHHEADLKVPFIRTGKNDMYIRGYVDALKTVRDGVEKGLWHWQEGSE